MAVKASYACSTLRLQCYMQSSAYWRNFALSCILPLTPKEAMTVVVAQYEHHICILQSQCRLEQAKVGQSRHQLQKLPHRCLHLGTTSCPSLASGLVPSLPDSEYHQGFQRSQHHACCHQTIPLCSWLQLATNMSQDHPSCHPALSRAQLQGAVQLQIIWPVISSECQAVLDRQ